MHFSHSKEQAAEALLEHVVGVFVRRSSASVGALAIIGFEDG